MTLERSFGWAPWLRGLVFTVVCALPAALLAVLWQSLPDSDWLRWTVIAAGMLAALSFARVFWPRLSLIERLSLSLVCLATAFSVMSYLLQVTDYPFKLSWSEGNRFYDYSLLFGSSLYNSATPLKLNYNEPGRYVLWGVLFAIPGLPIWIHRLWNGLLFSVPALLVGIMLGSWIFTSNVRRWHFALWVFLLLVQGPIYPSILLVALLVLVSWHWKSLWLRAPAVFLAGFYAVLSRWTWLPAAGVWAALLVLLWNEYNPAVDRWGWLPVRKKVFLEAAGLALTGWIGGILAKPGLLVSPGQSTGFALQQPLLLYRLLPNATYPLGILPGLALAVGPLSLLLIWLALRRCWRLSWLQFSAAALPAMAFAGIGVIASTKIGGGSNLHNLDMFLITLAILSGLGLRALALKGLTLAGAFPAPLRYGALGLAALAVLIPAWNSLVSGGPLQLPDQKTVEDALATIQAQVDTFQPQGEVLFMDHRQLLTFGYIHGVKFLPDYEMKFMMDQSMTGDAARFRQFYTDLANRRFRLIVVHPLESGYQGPTHNFGEENDAWVKWVAEPLLCYYQPKTTLRDVRVLLMVPRAAPRGNCPKNP